MCGQSFAPPEAAEIEAGEHAATEPAPVSSGEAPQPTGSTGARGPKGLAASWPAVEAPVARTHSWFVASTVVALAVIATAVWALVQGTPPGHPTTHDSAPMPHPRPSG